MSRFSIALEDAFHDLANPENALRMRKYMREQFPFLGIKKPERAEVFLELYRKYQYFFFKMSIFYLIIIY